MAFHFALEAILRLRRGHERMERLKLEAIASEKAQARRQLDDLTEEFFESRRLFQQQAGIDRFGSELQFEDRRSEIVTAARRALKLRIEQLEGRRLTQLDVYTKARQAREMLENLRHKKFQIYRQTLSRREQQELDDLFLLRQSFSQRE